MAVLQAVTIVGVDEAIVKREEEESRKQRGGTTATASSEHEGTVLFCGQKWAFGSSLWRSYGA